MRKRERELLTTAISGLAVQVVESRTETERVSAAALELSGQVKALREENERLREAVTLLAADQDGLREAVKQLGLSLEADDEATAEAIRTERLLQEGIRNIMNFSLGGEAK